MCGRMLILTYDEAASALRAVRRGVDNPYPDWPARAPINAFPRSEVPVALGLEERETDGKITPDDPPIRILRWGYPVQWQAGPVFNTRIESLLAGKGMWRASAENGRCLVPTRGFFERHGTEKARSPKTGRPTKRLYEFTLADEPVTWLAGVNEDGHFSVVTTEPNRFVAPVHHRMPLVLRREELPLWLGGEWGELADRSDVELAVSPEDERPASPGGEQLSLF